MCQWYDKDGKPSVPNCLECPKCHYRHGTTDKLDMTVMTNYKSLPVHAFCPCGKDLGKVEL